MREAITRARQAYGAHPLHLLALLACFALAGYVASYLLPDPSLPQILIWFAAAVIGHDLVLFPLYALADRVLSGALALLPAVHRVRVPLVNYVRTPVLGAALLLVLFLPGIIQQGALSYRDATGQTQEPYLARWLLISAAMFVLSALVYLLRSWRAGAPQQVVLRQVRPLLEPGERIAAVAQRTEGRIGALGSPRALYYESTGWRRIDWTEVTALRWHAATDELVVDTEQESVLVPLTAPGDLLDYGRARLAESAPAPESAPESLPDLASDPASDSAPG